MSFTIKDIVVVNVEVPQLPWVARAQRRDALIAEVSNLEDLGSSFDLSAFPLPMRIGPHVADAGLCFTCYQPALHVYMRILPRGLNELPTCRRDAQGMIELNTCTEVSQLSLDREGPAKSVEKIRGKIRDMVMHEVYEALLFRGERIMDPHHGDLRPSDQPF
jgi:hypothetical protein